MPRRVNEYYPTSLNHIGTVDREFEPRSDQTKTIKLVFAASPLGTHHSGVRTKTGWLGIISWGSVEFVEVI